jgi:predicted Zn-dependent peptidase
MNHQISTLANNIRVATIYMPHVETASVSVFNDVGSRTENADNNGISHFIEHMLFKGTKTRSALDIAVAFDNIGGNLNAYTGRENTVYYAKVLKEDVRFTVEVLADMVQNSIFDKEELERERDVVLQEIAQSKDTPDDIIFDHYQEAAFPNQSLGRPVLGSNAIVSAFNKQHIEDYMLQNYNGSNTVVAVAGNVEHEEVVKYVEEYFSNIEAGRRRENYFSEYQGSETRIQRDLEQVHVVMGFKGVSYNDPRFYAQQVMSLILGGGMSSRLFQEIREKRGLAYTVSSFAVSYQDSGLFSVYAGTSPEQSNELIAVVCEELLKATDDIKEVELQKAKTQVKAGMLMGYENTQSRSEEIGSNLIKLGRHVDKEEILQKLEALTASDIHNIAKDILSSKITTAFIGNVKHIESYEQTQGRVKL